MNKKRRPANRQSSRSQKGFRSRLQSSFKKFKKVVEIQLGQIDWKKVGVLAIAVLLLVATKGLLGPEAQIIAHGIVQFSAFT